MTVFEVDREQWGLVEGGEFLRADGSFVHAYILILFISATPVSLHYTYFLHCQLEISHILYFSAYEQILVLLSALSASVLLTLIYAFSFSSSAQNSCVTCSLEEVIICTQYTTRYIGGQLDLLFIEESARNNNFYCITELQFPFAVRISLCIDISVINFIIHRYIYTKGTI